MKLRLRVITKNRLQFKFLALILLSIIVPIFLVGGCLYYFIFQIMAEQLGIPESIAQNLVPVLHKINFLLALSLPPVVVLILIMAVSLTHRFVGPLERLENDLREISRGDYSIRLKIRKDDDLRPIADVINKIVDRLERK